MLLCHQLNQARAFFAMLADTFHRMCIHSTLHMEMEIGLRATTIKFFFVDPSLSRETTTG